MFSCKHNWKVLSETVTESKFQSFVNCAPESARNSPDKDWNVKVPPSIGCCKRKHIQIVSCDKCGKLKRYVEKI